MCGRHRLTAKDRYLQDHFGLDEDPRWTPRWNIAPTQYPIIRQKSRPPARSFDSVRWGMIYKRFPIAQKSGLRPSSVSRVDLMLPLYVIVADDCPEIDPPQLAGCRSNKS